MKSPRFARVTTPGPPKRRAWRIKCGCARSDDVVDGGGHGLSEEEAARRFASRGWKVGRGSHHTCPVCLTPRPPPVKSNVVIEAFADLGLTPKPPEAAMPADPPPVATREDNRRIHEKIDAVWSPSRDCYSGGWSDRAVAEALDVPRAWVPPVREAFFGPDECEDRLDGVSALPALAERAKVLEARGLELAADAEALRREVEKALKAVRA